METRPQPNCTLTPLGTHTGEGHPNAFETVRSTASTQLCSLDDRPHRRTPAKEKTGGNWGKTWAIQRPEKGHSTGPTVAHWRRKKQGKLGEKLGPSNVRSTGEKLGPSNARKKVNRLAPLSHTGEGKNRGEVGENLGHTNAR